jgi:hypothetical protein
VLVVTLANALERCDVVPATVVPNRRSSIVGALCAPTVSSAVTDASSTPSNADGGAAADGGTETVDDATDAVDGGTDGVDDRPERPPSQGLVETLGVVDHAKRGLAVGVALAAVVFAFFVVLPLVDPSTPARAESPVLYVALAFVVATSATLLVASVLAVRAVAGRVMTYEKWVRRAGFVGAVGGLWWAVTGALALGVATGGLPASVESFVLATLPLPVLVLAIGAWSALARTGGVADDESEAGRADRTESSRDDRVEPARDDRFDHVLARPRAANAGILLVLAGIAVVHVTTFLQTGAFLGTPPADATGAAAVVLGGIALAAGTGTLAALVRRTTRANALPASAAALAGTAIPLAALATTTPLLAPLALLALPGLAWLALGIAITRDTGTYPERPI